MRKKCTDQVSIFDLFSNHEIGKELKAMSERIDRHRQMLDWVVMDLHLRDVYDTGRQGLPAESVLRCALLKQYRQLSYQELAFHVSDSASFQAFARLPGHLFPKKSALQQTISRIQPETWERINQCLLLDARHERVELGEKVRIDSTVTETDIHAPTDSTSVMGRCPGHGAPARIGPVNVGYCRRLNFVIIEDVRRNGHAPSSIPGARTRRRCCIGT